LETSGNRKTLNYKKKELKREKSNKKHKEVET
jgi:hypothetical protein